MKPKAAFVTLLTSSYCSIFHAVFLAGITFIVYSNNFHHDFHLDSGHLIPENSSVRSLKNIPSYFVDPATLSALPSNIDYRPVLQATYALNYFFSGYATWSWHLVQIILHLVCVLCLYVIGYQLQRQFDRDKVDSWWISFVVALFFAVHPVNSGVINYLSARSSLLTAAFIMPSIIFYMRRIEESRYRSIPVLSGVFYLLAIFTKVEAVGALPLFFLYDMLQTARKRRLSDPSSGGGPVQDALATCNGITLRRISLLVMITVFYFVIRFAVMARYDSHARYAGDMTPLVYLFTQITAWWYYVRNWFAPVNLVADTLAYPVFRSLLEPPVLLAVAGWLFVAFLVRINYRKEPYIFFIVLSSWSLIAPTSTIAPLAEMVNEHRPYLPLALLSCSWIVPVLSCIISSIKRCRPAAVAGFSGILLMAVSFFVLTYKRNEVFKTNESYCRDCIAKAPSARSYANYGLTFMQKNRYDEALRYYQKALEMAPNWHIVHINLGLIHQMTGNEELAIFHFNRAVETDRYSGTACMYRGEFLLHRHQYRTALEDFEKILPLQRERYRIWKGAATAETGLNNSRKALFYVKQCHAADAVRLESDIVSIAQPFWVDSLHCDEGIRFFKAVDSLYPDRWWIHYNIGDLARRCNDTQVAEKHFERSRMLKSEGHKLAK